MTNYKYLEYALRYTAETAISFGITYGQIVFPEIALLIASTDYYYQLGAVAAWYFAEFTVYSLFHPWFYQEWNNYCDSRGTAMLFRGARDILQAAATFSGYYLMSLAFAAGTFEMQVCAAIVIVLLKALIDLTYDSLESKFAKQKQFGKMGNGWQGFTVLNEPSVDDLLTSYENKYSPASTPGYGGW